MFMKKLLVSLCLIFAFNIANSQVLITLLLGDKLNSDKLEFGLEGGLNWSKTYGFESGKYHGDWFLGFYFDFKTSDRWHIITGVHVKSKLGLNKLSDNDILQLDGQIFNDDNGERIEGKYSLQMNYFMVPVLARYSFKNNIYLELGPGFGLNYKSFVQFDSDIDGTDVFIREYNTELMNRIDAGINFGAGYRLFKGTGWTIGAKYYYGFVNTLKGVSGTNNSSFFVKLNIPIGAGEGAKQKQAKKAAKKAERKAARKD